VIARPCTPHIFRVFPSPYPTPSCPSKKEEKKEEKKKKKKEEKERERERNNKGKVKKRKAHIPIETPPKYSLKFEETRLEEQAHLEVKSKPRKKRMKKRMKCIVIPPPNDQIGRTKKI